jgi:N-acetyl-anhydromuramyl-L-alanine amidase AmpD
VALERLGPHVIKATPEALAWARTAAVVKGVGTTAPLRVAAEDAVRVYRWPWSEVDQNRILSAVDGKAVLGQLLDGLAGYRHERLYVELLNEVHRDRLGELIALHRAAVPSLHAAGLKVAAFSWSTGGYEPADWRTARAHGWCGADAVALHAYWGTRGFSVWHALRHRACWQPGDPPVLVGECGRDAVEGGAGGWRADGLTEEQYLAELRDYDRELASDGYLLGGCVFTAGPTHDERSDWRPFGVDALCARLAALSAERGSVPWPPRTSQEPPTDWCPFATRRPIAVNYTPGRAGRRPLLIVDHIADGYGSPFAWFNTDRGASSSSAHFWVSKGGEVEQYRPLSDTCWANGPTCDPDLSNPVIADLVATRYVGMNSVTVGIEHEGRPGERLPAVQVRASRALHVWLGGLYGLPLDRTHVVGHYQIDACTRPNCPGPTFPWAAILAKEPTVAFDITKVRDQLWTIAGQLEQNGYPWLAAAIKAAVALSKAER